MKKITLFYLSLLGFSASAQITYLSSDYATANEDFTMTQASAGSAALLNYAATGANHNWNFGNLSAGSQNTFSYMSPNNTGYKISWCFTHGYLFNCNSQFNNNFNLAHLLADGAAVQGYGITNIVEHSKLSATSLETKMVGMTAGIGDLAAPVAVDYSAPDVVYHFPMVYGDSYSSSAAFNIDLNALGFPMAYGATINRTTTVQGWGSLVTPMGTFSSVLKLKSVVVREDVISVSGVEIPIPTTTVSYKWFDKDYGVPVLQADGMEVFGIFIPLTVTYLDEPQCLQPLADFALLPGTDFNPDTQAATVAFVNNSSNFNTVSWDFGDGSTSTDTNPSHDFSCPGVHEVTLTVTNSICVPSVAETIVVPVTVTDSQNAFTTAITVDGMVLTADRSLPGTTYQWIDCDSNEPIIGADSQSFTATATGNYACQLSSNGCESLTECVAVEVLQNAAFENQYDLALYPNPTNGQLQLRGKIAVDNVEVFNVLGMRVGNALDLSPLPSGTYLVKLFTASGTFTKKIIKN